MANENSTNNQNKRQPSMRELANERMRQMRAERTGSSEAGPERRNPEERVARPSADREAARRSASGEQRTQRPSAEREAARREGGERRPSAEREAVKRSSSGEARRPDAARRSGEQRSDTARRSGNNASRRPAARDAIETERRTSQSSGTARRNTAPSKKSAPKKKKTPVFWIGLGIYTVILLILSFVFLKYTDSCLKKYENSQSENYMAEYIKEFESNVNTQAFTPADFTFKDLDLTFVDSNTLLENYIATLESHSSFTAQKDPTSYITEAPVYNIISDGETVAKVTLKAVSQTKIFAILTIMDWDVDTIEPVCSIDVVNYTFSVPEGYSPVIDGLHVSEEYMTGNVEEIPEFAYVSNYVDMPSYVEYKVDNVINGATIKVLNAAGEEVPIEINGTKVRASYSAASNTLSDERRNEALSMVQTYEDFNTSDLSGPNHGLATVQAFFIKDSDYWNMAKQWATGVDITFTSAHTFDDPKYTNVVVDNYCEYSDICYSLHIAFSKNMILTRTKEKISNDYDSTVFFVYYDDSDDGIDNPHWCIADMIATTKETE
ncbi:MAG: hypothetical protein J5515_03965 [Lachnospiraceae bacterium]|nr:hypothetical protein [Lachnospiraceae bacterium]